MSMSSEVPLALLQQVLPSAIGQHSAALYVLCTSYSSVLIILFLACDSSFTLLLTKERTLGFIYLASALLNPLSILNAYFRHPSFSWKDWKQVIRLVAFLFMFYRFIVTLVPFRWTYYWLVVFGTLLPLIMQYTMYASQPCLIYAL